MRMCVRRMRSPLNTINYNQPAMSLRTSIGRQSINDTTDKLVVTAAVTAAGVVTGVMAAAVSRTGGAVDAVDESSLHAARTPSSAMATAKARLT